MGGTSGVGGSLGMRGHVFYLMGAPPQMAPGGSRKRGAPERWQVPASSTSPFSPHRLTSGPEPPRACEAAAFWNDGAGEGGKGTKPAPPSRARWIPGGAGACGQLCRLARPLWKPGYFHCPQWKRRAAIGVGGGWCRDGKTPSASPPSGLADSAAGAPRAIGLDWEA